MIRIATYPAARTALFLVAASSLVVAQSPSGGWRRVTDPPPPAAVAEPQQIAQSDAFGQPLQQPLQQDRPPAPGDQSMPPAPAELTLPAGTFVTVRVNQMLSSDRNQPGDAFSATFAQPVVIDGIVVAQRGQTVYGRVAEAERARSSRPSRLGLELTGITLVDGTQVTVRSQLVSRHGGTSPAGEQFGTVAATTVAGAAVGAAADWGRGAAIGAGVGAAAGAIGVMLTRNHPTVVYPETALTFRIDSPVPISTVRASAAFRNVDPYEYDRPETQVHPQPLERRRIYYGPAYDPYYPYYYPYSPYRWGPGISLVFGGGWYRGGYWGRGGYRRWR